MLLQKALFHFFNGHLDCFCVLAIVNSVAMNTGVHIYNFKLEFSLVSLKFSFFLAMFSGLRDLSSLPGIEPGPQQ